MSRIQNTANQFRYQRSIFDAVFGRPALPPEKQSANHYGVPRTAAYGKSDGNGTRPMDPVDFAGDGE
jgi:hypothetical protein